MRCEAAFNSGSKPCLVTGSLERMMTTARTSFAWISASQFPITRSARRFAVATRLSSSSRHAPTAAIATSNRATEENARVRRTRMVERRNSRTLPCSMGELAWFIKVSRTLSNRH